MKIKILLYALALPLLFTACKKDHHEPDPYFPEGKIPDEVLEVTGVQGLLPVKWVKTTTRTAGEYTDVTQEITRFEYDDKNRITSMSWEKKDPEYHQESAPRESPPTGPTSWERRLVYHEKGYLVREEVTMNLHPERTVYYAYEDGSVWVKDRVYDFEPSVYVSKITFDENGRIMRKSDPTGLHYQTFRYDQNGNVDHYKFIIGGDSGWQQEHTYDDQKGILSSVNTPQWYLAIYEYYGYLNNNKVTEKPGRLPDPTEYRYNEQGYPVSYRNSDERNNYMEEYTIEYIQANVF